MHQVIKQTVTKQRAWIKVCGSTYWKCSSLTGVPITCLLLKWNKGNRQNISDFFPTRLDQLWDHLCNIILPFRKYVPFLTEDRLILEADLSLSDTSFCQERQSSASYRKQYQQSLWEVIHQPTFSHPPRHSPSLVCTFRVAAGREDGIRRSEDVRQVTREAFHLPTKIKNKNLNKKPVSWIHKDSLGL